MHNDKPSADYSFFVAVGLFILAWKLQPAEDWYPTMKLVSPFLAFCGVLSVIEGVRASRFTPSPIGNGLIANLIWALRPRSWMIAWGVIIGAAHVWGTPHILYTYPAAYFSNEPCTYLGWKGVIRVPGRYGGRMNGCDAVTLM